MSECTLALLTGTFHGVEDGAVQRRRAKGGLASRLGWASAVVCRDTHGLALNMAQKRKYFPATSLVFLSWFQGLDIGLIEQRR